MSGSAEPALADAILDALRPQIISIVHAELERTAAITSDQNWLTDREVSARFKIPLATIQYWRLVGGKGPRFHKQGRSVRYLLSEVEAWNVNRGSP